MPKTSSFGEMSDEEKQAFAARVRTLVAAAGSQQAAADFAGCSVRQIAAYVAAESAPPLLNIARLAAQTGFSLDWVVDGREPQRRDSLRVSPERRAPYGLDSRLMGRLVDALARVYEEFGVRLPNTELGRIAGDAYADIASAGGDETEQLAMVRAAAAQHRRQLTTETPRARKRPA